VARDTNFYYSFLVLPAEKRRAIIAVWDFCRAVDDAVDEIGGEVAVPQDHPLAASRPRAAPQDHPLAASRPRAAPQDHPLAASRPRAAPQDHPLAASRPRAVPQDHPLAASRPRAAPQDHTLAASGPRREAPNDTCARQEIARWRAELAAVFGEGTPQTRQGIALKPLVDRFALPRTPFESLIEGVEMDLGGRRYDTFGELYEYCIRVASAVGLVCLQIFGSRDDRATQYAIDLGVALQLTNILRDVRRDLEQGRVYIPQEDLRAHQCTEEDLQREIAAAGGGVRSAAVKALLRQQAERAREYYARAAAALPRGDARRLVAAEIMGAIYRAILRRIERRDYDVFSEVIRIPRPRRAAIAAATWARLALLP
jgi:15-cis-phytoene synthase